MFIYNYDSVNGAYIGPSEADPDPMEPLDPETGEPTMWLIPANATTLPPPADMPGNVRVFRDGAWRYIKVDDPGDVSDDPHPPSASDVADERTLRLSSGFTYEFPDERGWHYIETSKEDMDNWDEVTMISNALIMVGMPDQKIDILTGTGPVQVSAIEWQQILIHAGTVRQPIYAASFVLQAMDPIPDDFRDDQYWPVISAPVVQPDPEP